MLFYGHAPLAPQTVSELGVTEYSNDSIGDSSCVVADEDVADEDVAAISSLEPLASNGGRDCGFPH
jgi:hypothetical protein